jgi:7,8-dihydroneopterin aldolase/epimerase/oxygenase
MIIVALHGAEFFARHGFYPEEQILGGRFLVDVSVGFTPAGDLNEDNLANTVNYERLYDIVCLHMQEPKKLIETLAQAIVDEIKEQYPYIETATIIIKKLDPPMKGRVAHSSVSVTYNKP